MNSMPDTIQYPFDSTIQCSFPPEALNNSTNCDNEPVFFTGLSNRTESEGTPSCINCGIQISSPYKLRNSSSESVQYCYNCSNNSKDAINSKLSDLTSKIDFHLLEKAIKTSSLLAVSPNAKRKTLLPLPSPISDHTLVRSSPSDVDVQQADATSSESIRTRKRNLSFQKMPAKKHKGDPKLNLVSNDQLSKQIWEIFMRNKQTDEVYRQKMALREQLHKTLCSEFSTCALYVVGSSMTGLGANSSDMDMCLMLTDFEIDQESEAIDILQSVYDLFMNCKFLRNIELINAKVPILKFTDSVSGIEVDLNVNNTVGIRNTQLLASYARIDERLPPMVVLAKLWARSHGINDALNHTLSSYSLVLMVIHYLQHRCQPPVLPCLHELQPEKFQPTTNIRNLKLFEDLPYFKSENTECVGNLFLGFLKYFAFEFNYSVHVMSIRLGSVILKEEAIYSNSPKNKKGHWKFVCIEEPFDLTNTACAMFNRGAFYYVQKVFKECWMLLEETKDINSILR